MDMGFWIGLSSGLLLGMGGLIAVHVCLAKHWRAEINAGRKSWRDKFADIAELSVREGREVMVRINPDDDEDQ